MAFDPDRAYQLSPDAGGLARPIATACQAGCMPAMGIPAKLCDSSPLAVTS